MFLRTQQSVSKVTQKAASYLSQPCLKGDSPFEVGWQEPYTEHTYITLNFNYLAQTAKFTTFVKMNM